MRRNVQRTQIKEIDISNIGICRVVQEESGGVEEEWSGGEEVGIKGGGASPCTTA